MKDEEILTLSQKFDDSWLQRDIQEIVGTEEYEALLGIFPKLQEVMDRGQKSDSAEFSRTLTHVMRMMAIYNQIVEKRFAPPTVPPEDLVRLYDLQEKIASKRPLIMPIIIWLHDVGKPEDKRDHAQASFELVDRYRLLDGLDLPAVDEKLIRKVVQYHLVMGTIYTGESTYYYLEPLLNDTELYELFHHDHAGEDLLDLLTFTTVVDICGYPYVRLTRTHLEKYFQIGNDLLNVFGEMAQDRGIIQIKLFEKAREMTDWRLCCYLRMFALITTAPHYTYDFFFRKLMELARNHAGREMSSHDWEKFRGESFIRFPRVHFKYGMGFLCRLAMVDLDSRDPIHERTEVNPNLLRFLTALDQRILDIEQSGRMVRPESLWEVEFYNYPGFGSDKALLREVLGKPGEIERLVAETKVGMNEVKGVNKLDIDFSRLTP
ncbi:MAG: hypothetical protein HY731_10575 [Candidatus Tectomicrobia bacterium]|nr:hypothetical protein [Candidatus Tectomicrobia bacterium]